jgi:hypothetical protein
VLRRLGFRLIPAPSLDAGQYGPPVPPMLTPLARARENAVKRPPSVPVDGPFATLASFRKLGTRR